MKTTDVLAIDRKFATQKERMDAIILDINQGKFPEHRCIELLHENLIERDTSGNITQYTTFLAYAFIHLDPFVLTDFISTLQLMLGEKGYAQYVATPAKYEGFTPGDTFKVDTLYLEYMSPDQAYETIVNNLLPLLHFDPQLGYQSTLNYLSTLPGNEELIKRLLDTLVNEDLSSEGFRNILRHLSRSDLPEPYSNQIFFYIDRKPIRIKDVASLSNESLTLLLNCKNKQDLIRNATDPMNVELLSFYIRTVGFSLDDGTLHAVLKHCGSDVVECMLNTADGISALRPPHHALYYAVQYGNIEAINAILATPEGSSSLKIAHNGFPPLYIAARDGNAEAVAAILKTKEGVRALRLNSNGRTPMHIAVERGHVDVINVMLDSKDVRSTQLDPENARILFTLLVQSGNPELLEKFLALGSQNLTPNQMTQLTQYLLLHVLDANNSEMLKVVMAHGVDIWANNDVKDHALSLLDSSIKTYLEKNPPHNPNDIIKVSFTETISAFFKALPALFIPGRDLSKELESNNIAAARRAVFEAMVERGTAVKKGFADHIKQELESAKKPSKPKVAEHPTLKSDHAKNMLLGRENAPPKQHTK